MKVLSLFSGIGAFEKALTNMGVNYELVNYCEIDKYASKSYATIHGVPESKNLGDITKVDTSKLPDNIDLLTYGFPCQDISIAGNQKGFEHEGELTRSGLFFEALRLIEDLQPKIAICENVKNLTGKRFSKEFQIVLESLEDAGYKNYWQVLNAKDYGIPQNRERVFIISIREDIDKGYTFPKAFPLELRLRDMLDDKVEDKYYLDGKFESVTKINDTYLMLNGGTIGKMHDISRRAYSADSYAPTLPTCGGGNIEPKVIVENKPVLVGGVGEINFGSQYRQGNRIYDSEAVGMCLTAQPVGNAGGNSYLYAVAIRGRYNNDGEIEQRIEISDREYANSITTAQKDSLVGEPTIIDDTYKNRPDRVYTDYSPSLRSERYGLKVNNSLRIRKLTPKECFRLMGFSDDDFYKAEAVNSNSQLYKQAGNSIVVDVIEEIYEQLFSLYWDEVR